MIQTIKTLLCSGIIIVGAVLFGQQYSVGDTVSNFTVPVCANGEGTWELYDYYYKENGGDYHVVYIDVYKSW